MDRKTRREFLNSFVSEIIFNLQERVQKEVLKKEVEEELLREITKQNKEIEGVEESRLITRQFGPQIIQPAVQQVQIQPIISQQEIITEQPQESLRIDARIDSLLTGDINVIECANVTIRVKRNGEFEQTTIFLNEPEVKDLIKKFSEMTKMPISDNIFRATINNFAITAIVSDMLPQNAPNIKIIKVSFDFHLTKPAIVIIPTKTKVRIFLL